MKEDSGVEGCRDLWESAAEDAGSCLPGREYREGRTEEARKSVWFSVKAQRDRARREARRIRARKIGFMRQQWPVVESAAEFR